MTVAMPPARFRLLRIALVQLLLAAAAGAQQPPPESPPPARTPAPSSTSASGQFSIHGSDLATRSAFCLMCDDIAAALGRLLRDGARYSLPVVIVLKSPPNATLSGPAITWNISQLAHGGFHLQINASLRAEFRADDFAREVVRILLAERILRSHKELKTSRQNILPNWVLTGVTQALEFRGRSRPSVIFAAIFRSGQIYGVDKILSADPAQLDALSRGVYETSACALVLALLEQADGPVRFSKFLDTLARNDKPDRELLRQSFPSLGASKNSLEKWWSLQMAALATPSPLETLGIDETEARLRAALNLVFDPLPEKDRKKKTGSAAPVKQAGQVSLLSQLAAGFPFIGGRTVMLVAASDTKKETAGAKKSTAKPAAPEPDKTSGKTKTAAKEPTKKTEAKPPPATDEKAEPAKRKSFNPLNWFKNKEKSPEESKKDETAKGKDSSQDNKKGRENSSGTSNQNPTTPDRESGDARSQSLPIEDFAAIWKRDDRDKIFQRTINQLNSLRLEAHPLYRPLIGAYTATIRLLISGKQKGVAEKLAELGKERQKVLELARAVESHLDWYEASQTRGYSGVFDDYLKLGDKIENEIRTRNDPLAKYLDTLEKEYGN